MEDGQKRLPVVLATSRKFRGSCSAVGKSIPRRSMSALLLMLGVVG